MMTIDKDLLGYISLTLTLIGYAPYFWGLFKRKINPHMFSWIIWGTVNGVVFFGQMLSGGGAGSWVAGLTSLICFLIVGLSFFLGEKNISKSDYMALAGALATIPVWYITKDPLWSVILATSIDVIGCYPTIRKSYAKPYDEPLFSWSLASFRSLISFLALENYIAVTMIFPIAMILTNGGIACFLIYRRYQTHPLQ